MVYSFRLSFVSKEIMHKEYQRMIRAHPIDKQHFANSSQSSESAILSQLGLLPRLSVS